MQNWGVKKWGQKGAKGNKGMKKGANSLETILLMKYNSRLEHQQPFQFLAAFSNIYNHF